MAVDQVPVIVDIHNAVNEEAWRRIIEWEREHEEFSSCSEGPRLVRFVGRPGSRSPKSLLLEVFNGRVAPFDRHDWLIERCGGKRVRYVVDFYDGKPKAGIKAVPICVDARPALDDFESLKVRLKKWFG